MRSLSEDAKINKFDLPDENERNASMYGYWAELLANSKNNVKTLKVQLKNLRSEIRMAIIREYKGSTINSVPTDIQEYINLKNEQAFITVNLDEARSLARLQATQLVMKTATGKEKDPTKDEIEARIKSDKDVIELSKNLITISAEINEMEAKGFHKATKEPTVADIDAMIDMDPKSIELEQKILKEECDQTSYQAAIDTMDKRKSALDNLTTLWCRGMYMDPKGKADSEAMGREQRQSFQRKQSGEA